MNRTKFKTIYSQSLPKSLPYKSIICFFLLFVIGAITPFPKIAKQPQVPLVFSTTEHYARFVPTIASFALPLLKRDVVGLIQIVHVSIATTIATHSLKWGLNNVVIFGRRLGERPSGSSKNMPSGHSSMIACALAFLVRRYGWVWLIFLPLAFLTMGARIYYNAHTIGALIAGFSVGVLCVLFLTNRFK
ncbi:lipid A 1-phosphatase LpxE [Helicobacter felis]|uniref:Lipid A 1-phosphatase n=1 Tax=Helicobacter felis (strain ATCC 49179 / CCUG 28539 / NCTC 12436 / CS1) TaxID=936155 RepID=E7AAS7_HELFC|nr:lipid A 1-phosphatase LpxE [Helicobacter felis]CBY82748.1 lipid A 1-phosphatase [Helicobacter felis ATCC 49179]